MKQYPVLSLKLSNGETLSYREAGSGKETVLLIHGNMSSSVHWQIVMAELEKNYHVIAPDMRGFGDSSYLNRFSTIRELADDLKEFVARLKLDNFTVVGWSTGGCVALELTADLPEKVRKVILLSSVPPIGYPIYKKDAQGKPILTQPLTSKEEIEGDTIQVTPLLRAYETNDRAKLRAVWDAAIYNLNKPCNEDYELYLDAIFKQRNLVDIYYSLQMINMSSSPTASAEGSGRLSLIKCPVTKLHGAKDLVVPISRSELTHSLMPGSKFIRFEDAGHSILTDDFAGLMDVLKEELA